MSHFNIVDRYLCTSIRSVRTFIRGSGLLPTYRHRTVLPVLDHTPQITLALGGLIGRHPRPRELDEVEGLDGSGCVPAQSHLKAIRPIAPLAGRAD